MYLKNLALTDLISTGNSNVINPDDYLEIIINEDQNSVYINQLTNDGVATGKAMVQLLEDSTLNLAKYENIVINIDKAGIQFLSFYTTLPPGKAFPKGLNQIGGLAAKNIEINIRTKEAAEDLLFTLTTTDKEKITSMWQFINGSEMVKINVPEELRNHLLELINTARHSTNIFKIDSKGLYARYSEHLMKKDYLTTLDRIEEFLQTSVQPTGELINTEQTAPASHRSKTMDLDSAEAILNGEILYTPSDERTEMFFRKNTLFLVDCGSPATLDNITTLAAVAKAKGIKMNELVINISHFHDDHMGSLTEVLNNIQQLKTKGFTKIRVNIPPSLVKQFTGYYLKNMDLINNLIGHRGFKINFLEKQKNYMSVAPTFPPNMTHYIISESFMYKDNQDMLVFLGDWNTPFCQIADIIKTGTISKYFKDLFYNLHRRKITSAKLFIDLDSGHLTGINNYIEGKDITYKDLIINEMYTLAKRYKIDLTLYEEHSKNNKEYHSNITNIK